jgi:hypothetical protein
MNSRRNPECQSVVLADGTGAKPQVEVEPCCYRDALTNVHDPTGYAEHNIQHEEPFDDFLKNTGTGSACKTSNKEQNRELDAQHRS